MCDHSGRAVVDILGCECKSHGSECESQPETMCDHSRDVASVSTPAEIILRCTDASVLPRLHSQMSRPHLSLMTPVAQSRLRRPPRGHVNNNNNLLSSGTSST